MFGKTPRPKQYIKDSIEKKRFEQSVTNKLIPTKLKTFFYQEVISKKYLSSTNFSDFGFQSGACAFKNLETVPTFL